MMSEQFGCLDPERISPYPQLRWGGIEGRSAFICADDAEDHHYDIHRYYDPLHKG
jgi:hypothetical protein